MAPEGLDVPEASRPMRGRKPTTTTSSPEGQEATEVESEPDYGGKVNNMADSVTTNSTGKRSTRNPQPAYVFGISGPPSLHPFSRPPPLDSVDFSLPPPQSAGN